MSSDSRFFEKITLKHFGARFLLLALICSAFVFSWMDFPSSIEAFTPGRCNSFFWQRRSKLCSARFEDSILPFFNLFCLLDFFSAFYYLICFLIFCLAFRLDRSFLRYFAILIRFQFLVLPCFLSLNSWGRAASIERTIAIIVCMFCGPIVLAHGCYMTREFRREMHFPAFCKLAEKYFLVGMNSLGTLRRVYWEWLYANSSSWCSLEATHFYFIHLFIYFFT